MKKPKFKFDGATIQKFLVLHCEKLVLVAVLGVMAWLVYMGYSLPGLDPDKTPSALAKKSDETKRFIDEPNRWTEVVSVERDTPMNLEEQAGKNQLASDPTNYPVPVPWKPENFPKHSPRTDPNLLPPQHLIVHSFIGPIFSQWQSEDEQDPTYPVLTEEEQAAADAAAAAAAKRAQSQKKKKGADPYGYGGMTGGSDSTEYAAGSGSSGYPQARAKRKSSRSSASGSAMMSGGPAGGYSGEGPGMSSSAGMGGYGYGGMGAATGLINPESIQGFQGNAQTGVARHGQALVLTAVVPFAKQLEEFANALNSSLDYDLQRDQPVYLGFLVERAEVSPDNLAADPATLDWKKISVRAAQIEQMGDAGPPVRYGAWAGVPNEVVDPAYVDPKLTHPAPPFMQRDIWPLLTHPDVPLAPLANSGMLDESIRRNASPKGENEPAVEDVPTAPGFPGSTGGYSGSGMQGSMPSGYGGSSEGYGSSGMGGARGPIMAGGMGGMAGSGGSGGSYGSGYGGGYGSGYGSGYGGEGMSGMNLVPPKYKLVRFTDTHVELGKHYRYRVAVQLNDPNHPWVQFVPPTLASLDVEVQKRIKAQDAEDAKNPKPNYRTYWRVSPYSVPSEVVSLPPPNRFFAGSVEQPGSQELIPGKPKVANGQPAVKVLTSAWDPVKVADIPAEESAYRGSILNFVKEAKVIHPVNHDVVDFKDYKFQTNAIVADLMGGESIPKRDKKSSDPLKAPGELLVVDAEGNLHVQNETDDIEDFRRLLVPEPKTPTTPAGAAGEGYPTGDPAESGGYNNYPGASGGRRPRSSARGNSGS